MKITRGWTGLAMISTLAALFIPVCGCGDSKYVSGSGSSPPPVTAQTGTLLRKTVDDYLAVAGTGVPGAIVAVKMNGYQPWYYATGSAEIDVDTGAQRAAMSPELPFRIASVTKMFVAHAVLLLAREGMIDLEKPVEYYLPGALTGRNAANADRITVGMLLNHTSGLYSYVTSDASLLHGGNPTAELPMNAFVKSLGQTPWSHSSSPQDAVLSFVNSFNPPTSIKVPVFDGISSVGSPYGTNPYFAPGGGFHYSNTNYYLLGLIIEKATGKTVPEEMERLIALPLGLADTYLPTAKTFRSASYVHGYADYFNSQSYLTGIQDALLLFHAGSGGWVNGDGVLEDFSSIDPSFPWTTGGMISSARDLLAFTEHVMKARVQTGGEAGTWIEASPLDTSTSFRYGRGIARIDDAMFGHGGQFAGYNVAAYWYSPLDVYIVVMTNRYSYFESAPNDIGGSLVAQAGALYRKAEAARPDPNAAIVNGLLDALEAREGGALRKGNGPKPARLPDGGTHL